MHVASMISHETLARGGRAALVIGLHVLLIYFIMTSMGLVELPKLVKPMDAVMVDVAPQTSTPKPAVPEPQLEEPQLDLPVIDTLPEVPAQMPTPSTMPATAISASPATAGTADLAVTSRVQPNYPAASRRAAEEGTGVFRVLVDESGRPVEVEVARSTGYRRLDQSAIDAIRRWVFAPARNGMGASIPSWTSVKVTFRLDS